MRPIRLLLRQSRTDEARVQLRKMPVDAEVLYQTARSYLLDFYRVSDPVKRRVALGLAMESLASVLAKNADHIPALRAKAVIHARAELLYYDPNLAYELGARVAKLEPHANAYLLNLSEWMSGEVRFTHETGHRVPHDPQLGLDRSVELVESVMDNALPYSNEETAAYFLMGRVLSRQGKFKDSLLYFEQVLERTRDTEQRMETLRELGASSYRMGEFYEAARYFYLLLQIRMSAADQWLLQVAVDQIRGPKPLLPKNYYFPFAESPSVPGLAFEDMAPALGVDRLDGNGTCSWGDFDGDGDLDLFLAGSGTFMAVFRNDGGKFAEVTEAVGLGKVPSGYSLNLIDYDNDGRLDLYVSLNGWSGPMKNRLFHNEGGRFVDVSAKSGADDAGSGFTAMWGDLDNDGWLDFVVANGVLKDGSVPQIYRNNRDGTFTNMTRAAGIKEPADYGAIGVALGDYDKDGDLDILVNGLGGAPNRLYRNQGNWQFVDVAAKAGLSQPGHNGFVCFFLDYNNDGWPDVLTTSLAPWIDVVEGLKAGFAPRTLHPDATRLFRNKGDGTFEDVTLKAGLGAPMGVMGAGVADLDNDGWVDLYFGTGDPQMTRLEPNRLFHNNGNGTFSDVTRAVGLARPGNKGHGVSFADIDNDGDLDLYAQLGGHYPGDHARNAFYKNLKGNQNHWLQVELRGVKSNRFAVGAQLTLRAGDLQIYREVKGSEGFGSTDPYLAHFGLGARETVDALEIRWPSGLRQQVKVGTANKRIVVVEGQ